MTHLPEVEFEEAELLGQRDELFGHQPPHQVVGQCPREGT